MFLESKAVEFTGEMKRFYITSYRNYLIENQYELAIINKKVNSINCFNKYLVDNGCTKDVVVDIAKDRVKLAYGSEIQVEVLTDKQVERILFYPNFPITDEIALNFCDEVEYQIDYLHENELITNIQYEKIRQLGKKFYQMSNDKTQDYWSLESLQNSEEWGQCRKLGREILEIFDEKLVEDLE
jgi:hypothetical protein